MRQDILKIIKSAKDVTNAIILTHNIDFLFIQSVVIPALRKCGSPALTIFADADCAVQTYQHQYRVLSDLGVRYRVVAVAMRTGFRFHPKAVFLSGPEVGTLLIGSGNLTFGGWRENGEVWFGYNTATDGTAPFTGFRDYMRQVIELCADPKDSITSEIAEAFDPNTRTWASDMAPADRVLGRAGQGESMIQQMKTVLRARIVEHLFVCSPYFDEDAEALSTTASELGANSSTVLVQSGRTNLLVDAAAGLGSEFALRTVRFFHHEPVGTDGQERTREAWLHAKFYAVQLPNEVLVFAGSANCSRAALTIPGSSGNAELMSYRTLPKAEFDEAFIEELLVEDVVPRLATKLEEQPPSTEVDIHIRAARMEIGFIEVAFQTLNDTIIINALADETTLAPVSCGDGWITFQTTQKPRMIVLVGNRDGKEVRSLPHWIDNEYALRVSARGRSLGESIHGLVRGGTWGIGAWTEVLSELYKHLQYMPKVDSQKRFGGRRSGDKDQGPVEFSWADVFANGYGLHIGPGLMSAFPSDLDGRIGGLRSMLLRWYGIGQPKADEDTDSGTDDTKPPNASGSPDEGDSADRPLSLPKISRPKLLPASERERKRALRLVGQVTKRLAEPDFLSERRPELLAADLKVAALLLRAGLADGWLTEEEFFDATLKIWLPLFFNAGVNDDSGWIEQRYLTAPSQEEFAETIRSVDLAAALACWALSTPAKATNSGYARFVLASVLGVARLPWLWQTGGNAEIAKQVAEAFAYTSPGQGLDWDDIERRWLTLIRRGYALDRLQKAIAQIDIKELSRRISQPKVGVGELLWQGRYGFCVAKKDCDRAYGKTVEVLILRHGDAKKVFAGPLLVPVAALLDGNVVEDPAVSGDVRKELASMVEELRVACVNP